MDKEIVKIGDVWEENGFRFQLVEKRNENGQIVLITKTEVLN